MPDVGRVAVRPGHGSMAKRQHNCVSSILIFFTFSNNRGIALTGILWSNDDEGCC